MWTAGPVQSFWTWAVERPGPSIALCGANPQLKAVVLDQKESLIIAKTLVEEHNLESPDFSA